MLAPKTRSPAANSFTPAPTVSTSPENSVPRIRRFGRATPVKNRLMNGFALRQPQSDRVTVVACTRTRTWSSFGTGRSTSSIRRTSGGPYLSWTTALMVPFVLARRGGTRSRVDSFDALPTLESTERDPRPLGWRRPLGRRRCACSVAAHTEVRHDALRVQGPRHGQAPRGRAECIGRRRLEGRRGNDEEAALHRAATGRHSHA